MTTSTCTHVYLHELFVLRRAQVLTRSYANIQAKTLTRIRRHTHTCDYIQTKACTHKHTVAQAHARGKHTYAITHAPMHRLVRTLNHPYSQMHTLAPTHTYKIVHTCSHKQYERHALKHTRAPRRTRACSYTTHQNKKNMHAHLHTHTF